MHHPGCWVTNSGCATQGDHKATPIAQAYATGRPIGGPAPHPGEGTRTHETISSEATAAEPILVVSGPQPPPLATEQWPVIGGAPIPARVQRQHVAEGFTPPSAPRRYIPPEGDPHGARKPLPKIYNRHGLLEYWYIPAALFVVAAVAFGVIWGVGKLTADDPPEPASSITPGPTQQIGGAAPPATAATTPNPAGTATPAATGAGKFKQGDTVVVTGAGDCLNVRTAPGRTNEKGEVNPSIVCLNDGIEVKVLAGPQAAGDLTWWKVATTLGDGWAAEDYLVRKP